MSYYSTKQKESQLQKLSIRPVIKRHVHLATFTVYFTLLRYSDRLLSHQLNSRRQKKTKTKKVNASSHFLRK